MVRGPPAAPGGGAGSTFGPTPGGAGFVAGGIGRCPPAVDGDRASLGSTKIGESFGGFRGSHCGGSALRQEAKRSANFGESLQ